MYTPPLTNLISTNGKNKGGMRYFEFCPIEWLAMDIIIHPTLRTVKIPISLLPGRTLLRATCLPESIGFSEPEGNSKSGSYKDQKLTGIINKDELEKSILLDTLRFHKLLVIYYDKNGAVKIIGNKQDGMNISSSMELEPTTAGKTFYQLTLTHQMEHTVPFYII